MITISAGGGGTISVEDAQDAAAGLLTSGDHTGLTAVYDDTGNQVDLTVTYGTVAGTAAAGDDPRLSDARPPTGGAGGVLSGTYPNPGFAQDMATQSELDTGLAGKADSGHTHPDPDLSGYVPTTRSVSAGTGLTGGGDLTTNRSLAVSYGTSAGTAAQGNDARLSDTRTPTDGSVTDAKVAAGAGIAESKLSLASDAAAGTASRRTLGTGATQAAAGNHTHAGYAATSHTHDYAASGHTHAGYATTGDLAGYVPTTQRALIGGATASSGSGAWTPNAATASEHRRTATGDTTVNLPSGGVDTQLLRLWFNASGAARTVTFASDYETTQPVPGRVFTIPSGTWGEVLAANRGGTWVLLAAYPQTITSAAAQEVAYAGTVTLDAGTGSRFKTTATGNMTINPPSNGTDGQAILYAVTASGANRTITLSGSIALTTALTSPYTVNSGKTGFFGLRYNGTAWTLIAQTQEL